MTATQKMQTDLSQDGKVSWTHFSHFGLGEFGRLGTVSQWQMFKIMEAGRLFSLRAGVMDYTTVVDDKRTTFELGAIYTFDPALWAVRCGTFFPYKVSNEVEDVGKTSVTFFSRLVNKLDGRTLATYRGKAVYVDRATRRPLPFPDWLQHKYRSASPQKTPALLLPRSVPQVPDSAFSYPVTVPASDVDHNHHNNQGSYYRYCCDAAQAAVHAGRLDTFRPDIACYPLKEVKAVFTGESNAGDALRVLLWQQDGRPEVLQCVVTRQDGDSAPVIFHGALTYGLSPVQGSRL